MQLHFLLHIISGFVDFCGCVMLVLLSGFFFFRTCSIIPPSFHPLLPPLSLGWRADVVSELWPLVSSGMTTDVGDRGSLPGPVGLKFEHCQLIHEPLSCVRLCCDELRTLLFRFYLIIYWLMYFLCVHLIPWMWWMSFEADWWWFWNTVRLGCCLHDVNVALLLLLVRYPCVEKQISFRCGHANVTLGSYSVSVHVSTCISIIWHVNICVHNF